MRTNKKVKDYITYFGKGVTPKYVSDSSIIVLNQKCIRNNKIDYSFAQFISDEKNYTQEKFLQKGDILINSTGQGTAGRVAFVNEIAHHQRLLTDSHILVLRLNNFYEAKCLSYFLFSIETMLQTFMDGSTGQGEFDKIRLFNLKVPFSEKIEDLKKIVHTLSFLDTKIELNNRINAELEAMAKTIYDYWFVQFDFPDENGKPYKSSGGKMVWNEELKREVPEGWEDKKLGQFGQFKNGINYDPSLPGDTDAKIINVRNISSSNLFVTQHGLDTIRLKKQNVENYLLSEKDILIARSGIPGATRMMLDFAENTIYCGFIIRFQVDSIMNKNYLFYFLKDMEKNTTASSGGTIMSNVNQDILNRMVVVESDEVTIKRFNEIINTIFKRINNVIKENEQLSNLRDWLLPMLMNGQIKVD